ncbi:MAG: PstS family phosphate ABC transporter substrate-binding protein [Dysgonamonadaceae bacterium]|jgi:phosphate transport system substrate-binding protein|nr:PstS family phosphate ABC transporter substrate-binding protein [Dysgonamonadaceae bacterium]
MTKQLILSTVILLLGFGSAEAQKIKGSDTVLPLSQKEAENYMKKHPSQTVVVTGGGSGVGLSALMEGTTDIAQSSRKIKFDERQKIQAGGQTVKEVIIAYDALAIVVHPQNRVSQLTREQLEGIFTGKITNWKEVGGADLKIVPYSRETSSGTYEFFKESVLKNRNYKSGILSMPATGAIVQSVSQTPGAIGYIGLAYLNRQVKALRVSYDKGKTFTAPSVATAKNGSYPVVRPLLYYYIAQSEKQVRPFIDYVLSAEGQQTVGATGFIPL